MFKKTKLILRVFLVMAVIVWAASPSFAADKPAKTAKSAKPEKTETTKPIKRIDTMIAVFDLEISDKVDKAIVRPLSESIRREIVMSGRYEVIDRGNMNKILGEQKFQLSGCASGECIVEAGQLLGVGKIVTGSIGLVGKTYYLSLSVINVETGKIENSSEDKCKCEIDDLIESSKRLVKKLLGEQIAETKPTETAKTTSETDTPGIETVFVKGGCYQMGESSSAHEVCVDDFYMGKYEVTQGQWKAIMGENNPAHFKDCGDNPQATEGDNCPVEQVSWNDVQDFINKLNNKTGKSYRLPTEAEWEYAARSGGKNEKYAGTSNKSKLKDYAWYDRNSGGKTHPVGQKKPNGLDIYDMSGNVWEWVNDWYEGDYYKNSPKNNPTGPSNGKGKVRRGGSWHNFYSGGLEATYRNWSDPTYRSKKSDAYGLIGFRVAGQNN